MDELKSLYQEMLAPIHAAMGAGETTEKDAVRAGRATLEAVAHLLANIHRIADSLEKAASTEIADLIAPPAA